LAVVNVTNRADVAVRLIPVELFLGHRSWSFGCQNTGVPAVGGRLRVFAALFKCKLAAPPRHGARAQRRKATASRRQLMPPRPSR
ncbi:MAG: hypothetical protein K2X74_21085, partial [Acetobacteraceae bacterium]|nr:hypothetical protein [Acetobacteraceae bacterium]